MPNLKNRVDEFKTQGKHEGEMVEELKKEGHAAQDIHDAMANKDTPKEDLAIPTPSEEMGGGAETEMPSPESQSQEQPPSKEPDFMSPEKFPTPAKIPERQNIENFEEVAESIVSEKLDELNINLADMNLWKEKTTSEMEAIKQEILRIRNQQENIQNAMLGKVEDYNKAINGMNIEVKTLGKVLEKILQPLTQNVKELSRITDRLKK